jgi:hypothetical protein
MRALDREAFVTSPLIFSVWFAGLVFRLLGLAV